MTYDEFFVGKTAIVTGGGSGMGRATADAFAAAGANIVVADISEEAGKETVSLIEARSGNAIFTRTDVANAADVEAMVTAAVTSFGRLDFAMNGAAIENETTPIADCEEATFDRLIAVNLKSVFLCMKYEIRAMQRSGSGGAIVNIASTNAFRPQHNQTAYTASKHGVLGLTRAAAIDYAGAGIRINAVCPGAIDTPMLNEAIVARGRDPQDVIKRLSLLGRFGQPSEIANAVLWLCSDLSSFTVGHALAVDAGYLAR
jgi:NAD(P)-dependent dehydrogenase (short-subunit alcohol dehydrogenase family)